MTNPPRPTPPEPPEPNENLSRPTPPEPPPNPLRQPEIQQLMERPLGHLTCRTDQVKLEDDFLEIPMIVHRTKRIIEAVVCHTKKGELQLVISTQQGCHVKCWFCDMGGFSLKGKANDLTPEEMLEELIITLQEGAKIGYVFTQDSLKITLAKGGEPLMNANLLDALGLIRIQLPVKLKISTTFPDVPLSHRIFDGLTEFAADYPRIIQPQISILSTDENRRRQITTVHPIDFARLRQKAEKWHDRVKNPRKFLLSFTLDNATPCDPETIKDILPPEYFAVRLRRWIPTENGREHGLERPELSAIRDMEKRFRDRGYTVIPGESTETEVRNGLTAGYNIKRIS